MNLVLTSHPGDRCVPASALHSHAGNDPHTTVRRIAGLVAGRAADAGTT